MPDTYYTYTQVSRKKKHRDGERERGKREKQRWRVRSRQTSSCVIDGVRLGRNRKRPGSARRYIICPGTCWRRRRRRGFWRSAGHHNGCGDIGSRYISYTMYNKPTSHGMFLCVLMSTTTIAYTAYTLYIRARKI